MSHYREQTWLPRGKEDGRDGLGVWGVVYIEWINNKVLLIIQGTVFNNL